LFESMQIIYSWSNGQVTSPYKADLQPTAPFSAHSIISYPLSQHWRRYVSNLL
jgi:hypothetical protein